MLSSLGVPVSSKYVLALEFREKKRISEFPTKSASLRNTKPRSYNRRLRSACPLLQGLPEKVATKTYKKKSKYGLYTASSEKLRQIRAILAQLLKIQNGAAEDRSFSSLLPGIRRRAAKTEIAEHDFYVSCSCGWLHIIFIRRTQAHTTPTEAGACKYTRTPSTL